MTATIAVVIASVGRRDLLGVLLTRLKQQSRPPDHIILSLTTEDDLPDDRAVLAGVDWVIGPKGSCAQRNTGLDRIGDTYDLVAFLDDDYVPSMRAIEHMVAFLEAYPDVVGANGSLLADGAKGPGVPLAQAERLLSDHDARPAEATTILRELHGLYGCNMIHRVAALDGVRFDDRLKLYGWQEDIDFSARLLGKGRLVKTNAFVGVHMGAKHGRTSGVRLGYSQVINPLYLSTKGTMRRAYALRIIAKSVLANHVRMLNPEPWVDRMGRVRGNWLGLADGLRGRLTPERIEAL